MSTNDPPDDPSDDPSDDAVATIRRMWDSVADLYHEDDVWDATAAQRDAWTRLLHRMFPPTEPLDILDVGCGPGSITIPLAELGHRVTGVDVSSEMLRVGRAAAEARGVALRLVLGQAERPPAGVGPVDAVVSRHLLWTLLWPETAVRAWAALTRPGGRVLGIDSLWSPELVRESDDGSYPPEISRLLPLLHARDLEPVRNVWRRAGLADVMVEELAWIDRVLRTEAPARHRPMCRNLTFYLVEGTRPPGAG